MYNSSPILELTVKFASQIYRENINKPLDGTYLADFGIDIKSDVIGNSRKSGLIQFYDRLLRKTTSIDHKVHTVNKMDNDPK